MAGTCFAMTKRRLLLSVLFMFLCPQGNALCQKQKLFGPLLSRVHLYFLTGYSMMANFDKVYHAINNTHTIRVQQQRSLKVFQAITQAHNFLWSLCA